MAKKFVKVPVRGITAEEVLALWQQGKLFVEETVVSEEDLLARCRQEVLAYVATINDFVTDAWRPYINKVWQAIVEDEAFVEGLVMEQKRAKNRYFVTSIVFNLQTLDVYEPVSVVSQLKLHLTLEGIATKNAVFKNWGKYAITPAQRRAMKELLKDFSSSLKLNALDPQ